MTRDPTVLVVERDELVRDFLEDALSERGFRVDATPEAKALQLELERSRRYDAIVADLELDLRRTLMLLRTMGVEPPLSPVVWITPTYSIGSVWARELITLSKPFSVEELMRKIELAIARGAKLRGKFPS